MVQRIIFNGRIYRRYPNAKQWSRGRYFLANKTKKYRASLLHRDIWKSVYGKIPYGYVIHHVDGDPLNNDIKNLRCLTCRAHRKEHSEVLDRLHIAARKWHLSDLGQKWHTSIARKKFMSHNNILKWKKAKYRDYRCVVCNNKFMSRRVDGNAKTCSKKCGYRFQDTKKSA